MAISYLDEDYYTVTLDDVLDDLRTETFDNKTPEDREFNRAVIKLIDNRWRLSNEDIAMIKQISEQIC